MTYLLLKAGLSGIIIMLVSEVAQRSPSLGALIASLPLVSILGIMWLWRDTADIERVANHAQATFWYVLPTLPMFLLFPYMLRHSVAFWPSLLASCVVTIALYVLTVWILSRFGITL